MSFHSLALAELSTSSGEPSEASIAEFFLRQLADQRQLLNHHYSVLAPERKLAT